MTVRNTASLPSKIPESRYLESSSVDVLSEKESVSDKAEKKAEDRSAAEEKESRAQKPTPNSAREAKQRFTGDIGASYVQAKLAKTLASTEAGAKATRETEAPKDNYQARLGADPVRTAQDFRQKLSKLDSKADRAKFIEESAPTLRALGQASLSDDKSANGIFKELSGASGELHFRGDKKVAQKMASYFGEGVDAADKSQFETMGRSRRGSLRKAMTEQVSSGKGADFAADVSAVLAERAVKQPSQRASGLATAAGDGFSKGFEAVTERFKKSNTELLTNYGRLQHSVSTYGSELDKASLDKAAGAMANKNSELLGKVEAESGQVLNAMTASSRALENMRKVPGAEQFATPISGELSQAAELLPSVASTSSGQSGMAAIVERSLAGETTLIETAKSSPHWSTEAREGVFGGMSRGAALAAAARRRDGKPVDVLTDHLKNNAEELLGKSKGARVRRSLEALETTQDPQKLDGALRELEQSVGSAASFIGATGSLVSNIKDIKNAPPAVRRAAAAAGLASSIASTGLKFADGVEVSDVISTVQLSVGLGEKAFPGAAKGLAKWNDALGAVGSAVDILNSIKNQDAVGAGLGTLALAASSKAIQRIGLGPALGTLVTVAELGRTAYGAAENSYAQRVHDKDFLQEAGFSSDTAELLSWHGPRRKGYFHAGQAIREKTGWSLPKAIDRFIELNGDISDATAKAARNIPYNPPPEMLR